VALCACPRVPPYLFAYYGVVFHAVLGDEDKTSDDCTMSDVRATVWGIINSYWCVHLQYGGWNVLSDILRR
jgi:hypothetical protein